VAYNRERKIVSNINTRFVTTILYTWYWDLHESDITNLYYRN